MKKRMLSTLLALVMLLGLLPTAALAANNIASGTGWVLDADGKLTISSNEGMTGWENYMRGDNMYYTQQVSVFDKGIIARHLKNGANLHEAAAIGETQSGGFFARYSWSLLGAALFWLSRQPPAAPGHSTRKV